MKQSRFTDEQFIGFLKQADAGMSVKELCWSGGFSQPTLNKWHTHFSKNCQITQY
jgi:putative transposase